MAGDCALTLQLRPQDEQGDHGRIAVCFACVRVSFRQLSLDLIVARVQGPGASSCPVCIQPMTFGDPSETFVPRIITAPRRASQVVHCATFIVVRSREALGAWRWCLEQQLSFYPNLTCFLQPRQHTSDALLACVLDCDQLPGLAAGTVAVCSPSQHVEPRLVVRGVTLWTSRQHECARGSLTYRRRVFRFAWHAT